MAKILQKIINEQIKTWELRGSGKPKIASPKGEPFPVITISREFGALGAALANLMGEKTNFKVWDKNILQAMAEELGSNQKYLEALDENPKQPSCLKNMGLIFEKWGRIAEESGQQDNADRWFDQAADVWTQAVRLNPGGYLDIENWLKSTGRSNVDVYF